MYKYPYFKVDVYSHFVKLTFVTPRGREIINGFLKAYSQWGFVREGRRSVRKVVKVFAARVRDLMEFRIHINQYEAFLKHLADNNITPDIVPTDTHVPPPGAPVDITVLPHWTPRDYQEPILEYLLSPLPNTRKLVEIQPGKGKTFLAASRAAAAGQRVVVIVKPQFMKKWGPDFEKICGIPEKETIQINGSAALMNLITTAKEGKLQARVVIISNKTMQNWITLYERKGEYSLSQGYDCTPEELLPLLGAGVRIIDEVHLDFHLNFKLDLYCHCPLTISLSATLINDDPFLARMYEVAYPRNHRYAGLAYDRYIESTALFYSVKRPDRLKTTEWGSTTYSHHAFEGSIVKDPLLLQGYFELIDVAIRDNYLRDYKPGNRLLVYCASINLCTLVTEHLKRRYPGKDVRRYCEEDPYENLMEAEVSVSTLQSAGTGHDIDKLSTVILTTAVSSSASNIQGFGRLRKLDGIEVRFVYFVCTDVPKHLKYHVDKRELLLTRALVCGSSTYPYPLG